VRWLVPPPEPKVPRSNRGWRIERPGPGWLRRGFAFLRKNSRGNTRETYPATARARTLRRRAGHPQLKRGPLGSGDHVFAPTDAFRADRGSTPSRRCCGARDWAATRRDSWNPTTEKILAALRFLEHLAVGFLLIQGSPRGFQPSILCLGLRGGHSVASVGIPAISHHRLGPSSRRPLGLRGYSLLLDDGGLRWLLAPYEPIFSVAGRGHHVRDMLNSSGDQ